MPADPSWDQQHWDSWQEVIDRRYQVGSKWATARAEREDADSKLKIVLAGRMEVARALDIGSVKDRENYALQTEEYRQEVDRRLELRLSELRLEAEMAMLDHWIDKMRSFESTRRREMELAR